jgi:hypothetical protein
MVNVECRDVTPECCWHYLDGTDPNSWNYMGTANDWTLYGVAGGTGFNAPVLTKPQAGYFAGIAEGFGLASIGGIVASGVPAVGGAGAVAWGSVSTSCRVTSRHSTIKD